MLFLYSGCWERSGWLFNKHPAHREDELLEVHSEDSHDVAELDLDARRRLDHLAHLRAGIVAAEANAGITTTKRRS
jgi:hypothetical protein